MKIIETIVLAGTKTLKMKKVLSNAIVSKLRGFQFGRASKNLLYCDKKNPESTQKNDSEKHVKMAKFMQRIKILTENS